MRKISFADYFVEFLIANKITDVFGYQGGMIAYIFDSLGKYRDQINYHSCGNEQGAAIAACSYAQASGRMGVAISTSGPGFTNLLTGMANAWFDSIPVLFVSGNVNTKDKKRNHNYRQNGFQEIQAAEMARPIVKKSIEIELGMDYALILNDAISTAMSDRMGPVYLDLPINICRENVEFEKITSYERLPIGDTDVSDILKQISCSQKPLIIAGAGVHQARVESSFLQLINLLKIPVVTTMPAIDLLPTKSPYMFGYIGGTGRREPGILLQNADFVITIGTRLCSKQIGHNMSLFAPKAKKIIRTDCDKTEFERKLKDCEIDLDINLRTFLQNLIDEIKKIKYEAHHYGWLDACSQIKNELSEYDLTIANKLFKNITSILPHKSNLCFDVGKNLNYGCQSAIFYDNTKAFMSAGLGTMGYAMPAAIGAYYGNNNPTFLFAGDGGALMNIQELNFIAKNKLPIKMFILNNRALGNIRIFQENYLGSRFVATSESQGDYYSCEFEKVANAFGIKSIGVSSFKEIEDNKDMLQSSEPVLFEILYEDCEALPGIVAGGNYLDAASGIPEGIVDKIKKIIGGL